MTIDSDHGPVMCVVGTRSEVIKMFPVVTSLRAEGVETILVNTGQHRGLCSDALEAFGIQADVDLAVMAHDQTPTEVAAKVLAFLGPHLERFRPSWLVVQGDTTTVLASAIAGSYQRIPIAHVEAGLRSYDLSEPFPEELNRKAVGAIASLHFAPTTNAVEALRREGVDDAPDMALALQRCSLILTDSGGLQEEGPAMGKRVLVLRDVTERPEAIECGMAELVGTDQVRIVDRVLQRLDQPLHEVTSPYGDGAAGPRIAGALQGRPVEPFRSAAVSS